MAIIKRISSKATPNKIVDYLSDKEKTKAELISGKDCTPQNAVNEFKATQELFNKTDGVKYHHIVQSFSPDDNITPAKAHELGKELAKSQFKDHEVFVVTHTDKNHIHNHLVVNSVNFKDGKKYRATNKSLWDIKRESNRQCERENLKTINLDKKAPERLTSGELRITLRGQIPWKEELKQCINFVKTKTANLKEFCNYLKANFEIETRVTNKTISYKHPDKKRPIRGSKLGIAYDKEGLENEFTGKEKATIGTGEQGRTNKTSRAKHKGKDGVREHTAEREFGEIDSTIRSVEQGVADIASPGRQEDREVANEQRTTERVTKTRSFDLDR